MYKEYISSKYVITSFFKVKDCSFFFVIDPEQIFPDKVYY